MKKKYIIIAITAIVFVSISWSQPINATPLITPLGTCDYNDYLQVDIYYPNGEVNLTYVYSSIDENALTMEKLGYTPATNKTRYLFESQLYFPNYWEQLNNEVFIFQDLNSKKLYSVILDMNSVETPVDPWMIEYFNISDEYNFTCMSLDETINNLTTARNEFNTLIELYTNTTHSLNITTMEKENITNILINKSLILQQKITELNNTKTNLSDARADTVVYRGFYTRMTSYDTGGFPYKIGGKNEQYTTIYEYETNTKNLEEQLGGMPVLLFFSISVTLVACLLFGYWKWGKRKISANAMEVYDGVPEEARKINRFFSKLRIIPKNVKIIEPKPTPQQEQNNPTVEPNPPVKQKPTETNNSKNWEKNIDEKIDKKIKNFGEKISSEIDSNHKLMLQEMKTMLSGKTTPSKN